MVRARAISAANPEKISLRELLEKIARRYGRKPLFIGIPWRLLLAALRTAEWLNLPAPFRSDSLIGIVYQNPAPDFSLPDMAGKSQRLSDYRGKVVFLNFWATWCVPCVEEAPEMEKLNARLKDRKFQMLTVAIDTDWKPVNEFYAVHNLTLPVFLDPGQQIARGLYKITGVPETFLIDANGHVVRHTFGEHWADPRIVSYIESLIRQQEAKL